jgi:hypothetical protein
MPTTPSTHRPVTDTELILNAVEASGLSARRFAERVMSRDERTIRRWMAGEIPIPDVAKRWLVWFVELSEPMRSRLMAILDR